MSFWNTSTGESAVSNSTSFEIEGGGELLPIPAGTKVLAIVEMASKRTVRDSVEEYAEIKWSVLKPEIYKNRKIYQKVWCYDLDPSAKDATKAQAKKDKALRMLAAIDSNAGGKLAQAGVEPTNEALAFALNNKQMVIGLNVWEMGDAKGNWVYYVGPKTDAVTSEEDAKTRNTNQAAQSRQQSSGGSASGGFSRDLDDEIPFN